jgi:CheY-like chemotaxis protein
MTTPDNNPDPLRILLIDDSSQFLHLAKSMLKDLGITQVYTARNGAEALDLIGAYDGEDFVDLILCDWTMPLMSGMDLLKQIRTCEPDMLFFMVTGKAERSAVAEAKAYGVNGFIKKPFSVDELGKKLKVASRVISHRKLEAMAS